MVPRNIAVSVPSGNFGNITAGILAKHMGLPIKKFIASTNANKTVPEFFKKNEYIPSESIETISNAMDVGNPSNFKRIMDIYKNLESLKNDLLAFGFNDDVTKDCIGSIFSKYNYTAVNKTSDNKNIVSKYSNCKFGVYLIDYMEYDNLKEYSRSANIR